MRDQDGCAPAAPGSAASSSRGVSRGGADPSGWSAALDRDASGAMGDRDASYSRTGPATGADVFTASITEGVIA